MSDNIIFNISWPRADHAALARACSFAHELEVVIELESGADGIRNLAHEVVRDLTHMLDLATVDGHDHRLAHVVERAHGNAATLSRFLRSAVTHKIAAALLAELENGRLLIFQPIEMAVSVKQQGEAAYVRMSSLAERVIGAVARLLPCADRLRYVEEYRAELYELALDSRRAQWAYAVRLLACALPLRRELRRDAREVVQGQ
jgi:hypothetical protein